jgi:hypothetical protein
LFIHGLHYAISLSLKFKEENEIAASFDSLMEDDLVVIGELVVVTSNIRTQICGVLEFFLSFLSLQIIYHLLKENKLLFLFRNII